MTAPARGLVSDTALPYVEEDVADVLPETLPNRIFERNKALRVLGKESSSPIRAAAGFGAWLLGVAGVAALTYAAWHGVSVVLRAVTLLVGLGLVGSATLLGRLVWRAGRAVVDAFCWWTLMPERLPAGSAGVADWSANTPADAVEARVFMLQGGRMVRVGLAVLGFLVPFAFLEQATNGSPRYPDTWPADQTAALLIAFFGLLVVSWTAGAMVFGGQVRANTAQARRDPFTRWVKRKLGRG